MCRFYRQEMPEEGDLVMVDISNVSDSEAYVYLLEYNNIEGMILAINVSVKRRANIKKLLRVSTQEVMQVIAVDKITGHVDLSKKSVQQTEAPLKKLEYDQAKQVHMILSMTAFELKCKTEDLYEDFGWDLYDYETTGFKSAYDAFTLCLTDPELVFSKINISEKQKKALMFNINKRMASQPIKLRSTFSMQCYTYEGIEAIRAALLEAKRQTVDENLKLVFQLISPPEYKCEVVTLDKNKGTELIQKAVAIVKEEILKRGGIFKLKTEVTRIGSKNDQLDREQIIAGLKEAEDNSSGSEDDEEGIDIDLDGDDIQNEEEEEDNQ